MRRCPPGCTCPRAHHPRFEAPVPAFLSVWLTIIVDNTAHLCINAVVLG